MTKQDCKFARGALVSEGHGQSLMSLYVALGCRKYFDYVDGVHVARECAQGSEFCLYLGTMDKWGNDYDADTICVDSLIVSLPSNSVNAWGWYMNDSFEYYLNFVLRDNRENMKWVSRVALWKHWVGAVSLDEMSAKIPPRHKEILGDEDEILRGLFKEHFGRLLKVRRQ